jgi:uncharacterized protein
MRTALMTVIVATLATPSALMAQRTVPPERQNQLMVSGTATVVMTPDLATISLGVSNRGTVVRTIVDENNAQVAKIIAYLKARGVKPEQIQTSAFVLRPIEKDGVRTGYEVRNSISVSTSAISELGTMIDAAIDSGANEVSGPDFTVQDEKAVQDQCLTAAFADAKAKAKKLAALGDRGLGRVVVLTDSSSVPLEYAYGVVGGVAGGVVAMESGTHRVACGVTVVFELK